MSISKIHVTLILLIAFAIAMTANVLASDYQHSLKADQMTFDWTLDGETLIIKLSAPTTGWVAIGFNPSKQMKDANLILGYVKKGKVKIFDEFGTKTNQHAKDSKQGGQNNVTLINGNEDGKTTTLEFSIPLNSEDGMDGTIDPTGNNTVLLAWGERDSRKMGHKFHKVLTVNLSTGAMK